MDNVHEYVLASHIWHLLTEPSGALIAGEHRQRARILSALLLLLMLLSLPGFVIHFTYKPILLGTFIVLCVAYALSRTRYITLAALLGIGMLSAPPVIAVIVESSYQSDFITPHLAWLVFPALLGALVLSFRFALTITVAVHVEILSLPLIITGLAFSDIVESMALVGSASGLILLSSAIRRYYMEQLKATNRLLAEQSAALTREAAEHRRTAEMLIASEIRYRAIYEKTPAMLVSIDQQGNLISVSDYWLDVMGHTRDDVMGCHMSEFMTQETRRAIGKADLSEFYRAGAVHDFPLQFVRKSGAIIDVELSGVVVHDDHGQVLHSLAVLVDVTERKQAQADLAKSEERHRLLLENAGVGIGYYDAAGTILLLNTKALEHLEGTPSDYIGRSAIDVFGPEMGEIIMTRIKTALATPGNQVYEDERVLYGESKCFLSTYCNITDTAGDSIGVQIISHDITQRKRVQDALQDSETRYRTLVELSPETIMVHRQGTIVYVNPAGVALFGAAASDALVGLPVTNLVHPDFRQIVQDRIKRLQRGDETVPFLEQQLLRMNGEAFWAEVSSRPIVYQGQLASQAIIHDITVRKDAEQRQKDLVTEREKVRALEEFINDMSHDFRTPLTVINTHIYLLQRRVTDEKQQKQLALMYKHSTRLMCMVNDMLEMFELDLQFDLPMAPVDLVPILHSVAAEYRVLAAEKNQTLTLEVPDISQTVWGHRNGLERVLVNLVMNAIQFTLEGGTITLTSGGDDQYVYIEVGDTGIGIREADRPHIFKRFFRADKTRPTEGGRSGLGLTIAEKIVEQHQGRIEVNSVENEGSTFRVILSRYTDATAS